MCGIAGYCLNSPTVPFINQIDSLLQSIRKRGPDDEGICFISRERNTHQFYKSDNTSAALSGMNHFKCGNALDHDVAFLHTRYAILDLSEKGHQPFISQDGSIIAIFNGEIYNYVELKEELSAMGVVFHTQCDTEVLVEGYARWKDALWSKLNGFWAVVLYDRSNQSLVLSRDRIGVAPLYYRETSQGLFFSSYIDSLIDISGERATCNGDAILGFLQTGFKDVDNSTFYSQIKTVPPAGIVHLSRSQSLLSQGIGKQYWTLPNSILSEKEISFDDAVKKFRNLFFNAVDIRLRSDVKLAFELSGGLDSSSVVAAASCLSKDRITTYTAKIQGADEEPYARSILQKYDVDYRVISKMENRFVSDYSSFSQLMEEPYDNPNAYTHYQMLKNMNADGIKVVITGAGGDEVFAGYENSFWPKAFHEWRRQGIVSLLRADWYESCRRFKTLEKSYGTLKHYFFDFWKKIMEANSPIETMENESKVSMALKYRRQYDGLSFHEQRNFHFTKALLPYYMRSSDHFTMGIPIEHRFPLLDYRIIEFGIQLPISYLFRNGWTKYILRKAMEPYLPSKIIWRRQKMGFRFPFRQYLTTHYQIFKPILNQSFPDYNFDKLLVNDPVLLWRVLSTAIWMEQNKKGCHV